VQFVALSAVSAMVFALLIALINITLVEGEPLASAIITCASHLSAVLLIVPLALFEGSRNRLLVRASRRRRSS
jgi:hypothetical protein